jgi:hypothetical protein
MKINTSSLKELKIIPNWKGYDFVVLSSNAIWIFLISIWRFRRIWNCKRSINVSLWCGFFLFVSFKNKINILNENKSI